MDWCQAEPEDVQMKWVPWDEGPGCFRLTYNCNKNHNSNSAGYETDDWKKDYGGVWQTDRNQCLSRRKNDYARHCSDVQMYYMPPELTIGASLPAMHCTSV